jgi:hypothetical protein
MIFFHGTTTEYWNKIQDEGVLFGTTDNRSNRVTYLATDFIEASCYGDVVLAVEYDPLAKDAHNNYCEGCWQIRVYDPIPISQVKPIFLERFVRIGDIPENETSGIYRGENKVGEEVGVSVYRAIRSDGKWNIVFPSPLRESRIYTLLQLKSQLEGEHAKAYLCGGDVVGFGSEGEPLIKNVEIFADITDDIIAIKDTENGEE